MLFVKYVNHSIQKKSPISRERSDITVKEISFRPTQNELQPNLEKDTRKRNSTLNILYAPIQQQLFKVTKETL